MHIKMAAGNILYVSICLDTNEIRILNVTTGEWRAPVCESQEETIKKAAQFVRTALIKDAKKLQGVVMTTIVAGFDIESTVLDFRANHKIIEIAITRYKLETQKHINKRSCRTSRKRNMRQAGQNRSICGS